MPWALRPIQVPPAVRSRPAITPGYSGHQAAGGSQARSTLSSRLATNITGQAWSGRSSRTTVHMGRLVTGNGRLRQWDLSDTMIRIASEEAPVIAVFLDDVEFSKVPPS